MQNMIVVADEVCPEIKPCDLERLNPDLSTYFEGEFCQVLNRNGVWHILCKFSKRVRSEFAVYAVLYFEPTSRQWHVLSLHQAGQTFNYLTNAKNVRLGTMTKNYHWTEISGYYGYEEDNGSSLLSLDYYESQDMGSFCYISAPYILPAGLGDKASPLSVIVEMGLITPINHLTSSGSKLVAPEYDFSSKYIGSLGGHDGQKVIVPVQCRTLLGLRYGLLQCEGERSFLHEPESPEARKLIRSSSVMPRFKVVASPDKDRPGSEIFSWHTTVRDSIGKVYEIIEYPGEFSIYRGDEIHVL
jgi:hypothetical protein